MIDSELNDGLELHRRLGAHPRSDGRTEFCVWAPTARQVRVLVLDRHELAMQPDGSGYHQVMVDDVKPGDRYWIQVDDHPPRPDPASRYQPEGVHGPSEVVDSSFNWTDGDWAGIRHQDWIVYETHIGCWTDAGTFEAAIDRLDELADLGVTAVELMPLADAAGRWNWGYDGVHLFAPNRNYGTPDDLRRFVDAAHAKNLAVFLDVVYNHLGPEGNYLAAFGPYLSLRHETVWGAAPNFDDPVHGEGLRKFFLANALYWFDEFHFDGLRVDAIHCMRDEHHPHIVEDLSRAAKAWSAETGRPANLIAESNVHDTQMIAPLDDGGMGFDAEWCDDFLHSVFAVVRPGDQLSDREYESGTDLAQTLKYGYVYEGSLYQRRQRQRLSKRVDTDRLVYSIQTHDFVGNHPLGQRLHQLTCAETQAAAAALLLLSPAIPMLFMGEEFAAEQPFQFFVDFGDEHLRRAVVDGRRAEYPQHDWTDGVLPTDPQAFEGSKIGSASSGDQAMRQWYQRLIQIRRKYRRPLMTDARFEADCDNDAGVYRMQYTSGSFSLRVVSRLIPQSHADDPPVEIDVEGELILDSRPDITTKSKQLLPNHAKVFVENST